MFFIIIHLLSVNQITVTAIVNNDVVSFIKKSCNGTEFPDTCISILEGDPRSKTTTDLKSLTRISMNIVYEEGIELTSLFIKAGENANDPFLKMNIRTCIEEFDIGSYRVKTYGIPAFEKGDYAEANNEIGFIVGGSSNCNDTGIKLFNKKVETSFNFSRNVLDLLSQINVEMGGKFFVVKIEEEQFSIEKQEELRGIIPVGRAGTLIPVEGGSVVENSEDVRRLSVDGDKATQEDSYERVGVSVSPITLKLNFENLAEMVGVNSKRSGSLGGNYAATDKFFEGVSGQERGKGPSKEKARDEVVIVGPMTEISSVVMSYAPVGDKEAPSGTPGLFQVEGSVPGSGSKSIRGRLKKHSMTLRSKQNSELRNLEDDVAKVLEKGLALGLNFNGRKEELLDIIAKRDVMNDNRFRDLVRRLLEKERDSVSRDVEELVEKVTQLEGLQTGPTEREKLEKESSVVEEDVNKFNAMIAGFDERIRKMEELVEEKDKEMKEKLGEHKRICHENEELKKKMELQTFNAHDAERVKKVLEIWGLKERIAKELKAVERDIEDAETARSAWEDKCWDLDATFTRKFKELEALSIECNQAIRRLKLSNDIRYVSSAKGSTPAEVMGIDYKSTLKPTLESFADEVNKSSMEKLEDMISPQQQSSEMAAKIEGKRNRIAALQSYIDEVEAQLNLIRKEMQEHTYRCAAEVKKMMEDVQIEAHNLDMVEREAAEVLKVVELKLQEAVRQSEEEIQIRACDLIALVDSVSKHRIHGVKNFGDEEQSPRNCFSCR
ncbi:hypothetical protein LWI29_024266 [Acer saccharum]|uniref:Pectinesterase inhibitor domain-containing protein n=1 Tax=Acer saccharum TaxID=4024 RepID=A0AA39W294_ACESA|nr:hypothetical protein LWI29_024266 [Acer saccharum]